jgi:S1-C subfamily serine protease
MKKRVIAFILVIILAVGISPAALAAPTTASEAADALYSLGLFRGTSAGFELDRAPSRQEAIVMLIRLLGKENAAVSGNWSHPFTDVDAWADDYVGYAYEKGLTRGLYNDDSNGHIFGGGDTKVTGKQYVIFVLRALEYSEAEGDFPPDNPLPLADSLSLTSDGVETGNGFTRGDAVLISYNALSVTLKNTGMTLLEHLNAVESGSDGSTAGLTGAQISQKCSTAVFYIEAFSDEAYEDPISSGSGFFISGDGVAVTCYHVLVGSKSARITRLGGDTYDVTDVVYGNAKRDIAIIRVSKTSTKGSAASSFPYLELGSSSAAKTGDAIYTISSPMGLSNSISGGMVSNSTRTVEGTSYIQISAPISTGSSGGPVLDEQGRVIGIICATVLNGQNLNLAIPIDNIKGVGVSAAGTAYSYYFSAITYHLTASKENVNLRVGQMETVVITIDYPFAATIEWANSDQSVVYAQWGEWIDKGSVYLYLSGISAGTAAVTITYSEGYGSPESKAVINVTVTE